ncbi:MAG: hypothetical protein C0504_19400 [Candidatus Solibacter sp.]|nr:hypothetical protein [Candidatus Solibacter sp.]
MTGRHISEVELALATGGDLGLARGLRVWFHTRRCSRCAALLEGYAASRRALRESAGGDVMSPDAWAGLSREMTANIRLGLAAGRIVDFQSEARLLAPEPAGWRVAVVMATLTVVLTSGWLLRRPVPGAAGPRSSWAVAEASAEGVGIHEGQAGLMLLGPDRESSVMLAGTSGGARARFIDEQTGQVTIHHAALED